MSRTPLGGRVFRWLTRLLPRDFRGDFGPAMSADLDREGVHWWRREIPGIAAAIGREHIAGLSRDVRYSARLLTRTPGFTAAAVLMLAVGTGANAAVYSVVDAVLIRPAFPDADRTVEIRKPRAGLPAMRALPIATIAELARAPQFGAVSPVFGRETVTGHTPTPRTVAVECVSPALFAVTSIQPVLGRVFTEDESRQNAAVAVISYAMWQRDFAGRPDVIGRDVIVNRARSAIVGVMPQGFSGAFSIGRVEAWAPIGAAFVGAPTHSCGRVTSAAVVGRVARPLSRDAAAAALAAQGFELLRLEPHVREGYVGPIIAMMGTAVAILLIACANVANLQLGRAERRRRELSVRLALGASRWSLVRQSIVENLMLSAAGAACGVIVAAPLVSSLSRMAPRTLPHSGDIGVDLRVLLATAAAALVSGVIVGLVPARRALRSQDLGSQRGVSHGGAMSTALVTGAIALSVLLAIAAGLMARTFAALSPDELGFRTAGRIAAELSVPAEGLPNGPSPAAISAVMDDLRRQPGITTATISTYQPLRGYPSSARVRLAEAETAADAWAGAMEPHFLTTLGATFAAGRDFDARDTADAAPVAIVNEAFVARFLGGDAAHAVGQMLDVTWDDDTRALRRIVGVVRTMRTGGYDTEARSELFAPLAQSRLPNYLYAVVETTLPPERLKAAMLEAARRRFALPVVDPVQPMSAMVDAAFARPRFGVWIFSLFAGVAAALAAAGLATAIAWSVAGRRREIAIRTALGSNDATTVLLVLRRALIMTATGVAAGAVIAAAGTRVLGDWLYGVTPTDPLTFITATSTAAVVSVLAAFVPAHRAARVDTVSALRSE
jgi:predicted permease